MKAFLLAVALPSLSLAQHCVGALPLAPGGTATGSLESTSCRLSDGAAYVEYHLVLPVRGKLELDASSPGARVTVHLRDAAGTRIERGNAIRRPIEAGRYIVIVSAQDPGQAGAFTLRTGFTAEPDVICAGFPALGLNQKVAGRLGGSGCATPSNAPYEAYSLRTLGPGTLEVSISAGGFTPSLILRGENGHAMASGDQSLSVAVDGDRNLTLVVTSETTGPYELTTSFRADEEQPCRAQAAWTGSERRAGTIDQQSCAYTANDAGDQARFDFYELKVEAAGNAELKATSSAFDPLIYLLDASGRVVAADALSAGRGSSSLELPLQPGAYTVMIVSPQPAGGAYDFQYNFQSGPPENCAVPNLALNQSATATISSASCRSAFGLSDVYRVTLTAAGLLELAMISDTADSFLALRDERDDVIVTADDFEGLPDAYIAADVPAGTYTVVAAAAGGAGPYNITSRLTAREVPPCARVESINVNVGAVRLLGAGPCRARNGQPEDWYEFRLPEDGLLAALMTSPIVDGYLTLTNASGEVIRTDDNSYGGGDPILIQYLPAGTYRLAARAAQATSGGRYELDILFRGGERPPGCRPRATLDSGGTTSGNIQFTGCQYDGDFADVYRFTIDARSTVDLRLESDSFDAYTLVLDGKGNVVAEDDDSAGRTNARITTALPAGTYYVIARPLSVFPYDSGGTYTLTYSAGPPPEETGSPAATTVLSTAQSADVDDDRHDQNQKIQPLKRLPRVGQPRVYQGREGKQQKPQQRNQQSVIGPLQVVGKEK